MTGGTSIQGSVCGIARMSAVELLEGKASRSAEQRKISFFAEPLGTVRSSLAEQAEVSVEFLYHYTLVLRIEIAHGVAPFRRRQRINRPARPRRPYSTQSEGSSSPVPSRRRPPR